MGTRVHAILRRYVSTRARCVTFKREYHNGRKARKDRKLKRNAKAWHDGGQSGNFSTADKTFKTKCYQIHGASIDRVTKGGKVKPDLPRENVIQSGYEKMYKKGGRVFLVKKTGETKLLGYFEGA